MRLAFPGWVVLMAMAAVAAPAAAQPARQLSREGMAELGRGNFVEARALFLRAHEAEPSARLLRAAGMASFELREYVRARTLLTRALRETRRALTARLRRETEELLERTEAFVGTVDLHVEPGDAVVLLDGQAFEPADDEMRLEVGDGHALMQRVLLDVGEHRLSVRAEGYEGEERTLVVAGGEQSEVTITLLRTSASLAAEAERERQRRSAGAPSLPLLATAAGLGTVAIGSMLWWRDRARARDRCSEANDSPLEECQNASTLRRQWRGAVGMTMTTLLAAAGATAAGFLLRSTPEVEPVRASCGLWREGGACAFTARF